MPVTVQKAGKIRAAAKRLDDEVAGVAALSSVIAEPTFRSTLDRLRDFAPPQNVPVRTRKGNPERRQFIWTVAEAVFRHFQDFHIEAITEVVALRWPETDIRNVRHELTAERKAEIAEAAKKRTSASGDAAIAAAAALTRAGRGGSSTTKDVRTDSQKIADVLAALETLEDKDLAGSLGQRVRDGLADFDYEQPDG